MKLDDERIREIAEHYFGKFTDADICADAIRAALTEAQTNKPPSASLNRNAIIHYPECWDTAAYPTLDSALAEMFHPFRCTNEDCKHGRDEAQTNAAQQVSRPIEAESDRVNPAAAAPHEIQAMIAASGDKP